MTTTPPDPKEDKEDDGKITEFCPKCGNAVEGWAEQRDFRCDCGIRWTRAAEG